MENIIGIVGMGKAAELVRLDMAQRMNKVQGLRDMLRNGILKNIPHVYVNGHPKNRLPGNLSLCIEYIEGESILLFLDMQGIAISSGSACTSWSLKASHVIMATGVYTALAQGTVLFSLGIAIPGTMLNTFWKNCHLPLNSSGRCHLSIIKGKREINPKI